MKSRQSLLSLRGVTVVELMIVIVIAGTLMSIAAGMFQSLFIGGSSEKEATTLIQAIKFCQQKAILGQKSVYLEFNMQMRTYRGIIPVADPEPKTQEELEAEKEEQEALEKEAKEKGIELKTDAEKQLEDISSNKFDRVEEIFETHEYPEDFGIVRIMDMFGGVYTELSSYIVAFHPNGSSQSLLIHLGNEEKISRTIYLNKYTGHIRNVKGEMKQVTEVLDEDAIQQYQNSIGYEEPD